MKESCCTSLIPAGYTAGPNWFAEESYIYFKINFPSLSISSTSSEIPIYISLPIVYNQQITTFKNSKVEGPSNQDFVRLEVNGYRRDEPPALKPVRLIIMIFYPYFFQPDPLSMSVFGDNISSAKS